MIADQATPATVIVSLTVTEFQSLPPFFQALFESTLANPSSPWSESSRHLPLSSSDPPGFPIFARLFLGQRRDGIALPLGKCRAGRWRYLPAFPFACQARCGRPHLRLVS